MLGDILHKCRHILDYHSNESVLMPFNRLDIARAGGSEASSKLCTGNVETVAHYTKWQKKKNDYFSFFFFFVGQCFVT